MGPRHGECLHGPLRGRRLEPAPLRHMHAEQALAQFPDSRIAFSRHLLPFGMVDGLVRFLQWVGRGRLMPPGIAGSMGAEDERRPRLEMGLGVWSVSASRYYPLGALKDGEALLIDRFDDRSMLIYLDPGSGTPIPLFARARNAEWRAAASAWTAARRYATGDFTILWGRRSRPSDLCISSFAGMAFRSPFQAAKSTLTPARQPDKDGIHPCRGLRRRKAQDHTILRNGHIFATQSLRQDGLLSRAGSAGIGLACARALYAGGCQRPYRSPRRGASRQCAEGHQGARARERGPGPVGQRGTSAGLKAWNAVWAAPSPPGTASIF